MWSKGAGRYTESREVGRLREEIERPMEAVLQGLLTCRLHISELQSSLISPCWVTEAPPFLLCLLHACLHFGTSACTCLLMCKGACCSSII